MERTIHPINSLADVQVFGQKLDEHTKIASYMKKGNNYVEAPSYKFVWNINKEKISNSVNVNFQVIQHRDIFACVHGALTNLNLDVYGRLDDFGDLVMMDLIFKGQKKIDDKEKGIELGIRVSNSNNKRCSFRLEMYAMRLICMNGMTVCDMIPGVRDFQIHFGKDKIDLQIIQPMVEKFVKSVINHSRDLQNLVSLAMKDSIEWGICEKILNGCIKSKKQMREIAKGIGVQVVEVIDKKTGHTKFEFVADINTKINRWDLYNVITRLISHDEQLKPTTQSAMEHSSRELLQHSFAELAVVYAK